MGKAFELARKMVSMDKSDSRGHEILAFVYRNTGDPEKAIIESEQAVALNPNSDKAYMNLADSLFIRETRPSRSAAEKVDASESFISEPRQHVSLALRPGLQRNGSV